MKGRIVWSTKEIVAIIRARQKNKFDANFGVSGKRGLGKSTAIDKLFLRFKEFKPWVHQVYSRDDVCKLLKAQKFGFCFDDEAINTAYKREFQNKAQQSHIKHVTAYRDNFNVYASAIPYFYSLDKDFRQLLFMHIHIIERGLAVILIQVEDSIHQLDPWDTKNNEKLEEGWLKKKAKDPNFKFPYHKLSTFAGYWYFGDLTPKQRKLYEEVKVKKRGDVFKSQDEIAQEIEKSFIQKLYNRLFDGKLSKEGIQQLCLIEDRKYSSIVSSLNRMLTDNGEKKTVKDFLQQDTNIIEGNSKEQIDQLVPDLLADNHTKEEV